MADFSVFLPIAKIDKDKRTVSGYASTPAKDSDGEIVTLDAIKAALPGYMKWGNVREMHKLSAVGTAEEANIDTKGLFLTAKIVDDVAWKKCLEGVYKGFSIGGRKLDKSGNKITEIDMTEISVVDRPANPECSFSLAKMAKAVDDKHPGYLLKVGPERTPEQKALAKMAKVVGALAKGGPPAAHDGFSLPAKPTAKAEANPSPNDAVADGNNKAVGSGGSTADVNMAPPACEKHGKVGCKKCAIVKRMAEPCAKHQKIACTKCAFEKKDKSKSDAKPYGDVEYADPGHQADGKARYPIDTEEHIRAAWNYINKPKNAAKYDPKHASSVKSKIVAAWKDKIHKDGPPGAAEPAKKAAQAEAIHDLPCFTLGKAAAPAVEAEPAFLFLGKAKGGSDRLAKGMQAAGTLSFAFDRLRDVQRSLMLEGKREGGDKKDHGLADTLGTIAKQIAAVIAQKAEHEGGEAVDLSDADDAYVKNILSAGDTTTMSQFSYAADGDPLTKAILDTITKAATPSPMMRMKKAEEEMAEARKTMKEAKKMIKAAHDMHKAAYLAKQGAGGDVAKASGGAEFDHVGAMEKLQKAYNDIDKARTFSKAAMGEMSKARAGQSGQEVSDGNADYKVPPGIKDLSTEDMKNAAAGGGDLAKYAKNGQIPADVAQLLLEKAATQGELEALRRLPAGVVGRQGRPYSFDTQRLFGGAGGGGQQNTTELAKALFDGVDVNALGSGDEQAHGMAAAKAAGNFLLSGQFGKSVFDPSFHGAAGSK